MENDKDKRAKKEFLDPVVTTPFIIWVFKCAGGAIVYTVVSFLTKMGLDRLWHGKDIDSNSDTSLSCEVSEEKDEIK